MRSRGVGTGRGGDVGGVSGAGGIGGLAAVEVDAVGVADSVVGEGAGMTEETDTASSIPLTTCLISKRRASADAAMDKHHVKAHVVQPIRSRIA